MHRYHCTYSTGPSNKVFVRIFFVLIVAMSFLLNGIFYYLAMCKCVSTTARVNGTFQFSFFLDNEIKHYYCRELWFIFCNTCNWIFSSLMLENGLKKHVQIVVRIKHEFVKLVVILFILNISECQSIFLVKKNQIFKFSKKSFRMKEFIINWF